jgi:hypothetical protein
MLVNIADRKIVVNGHGTKGRCHKVELETLKDPTILVDVGWQNLP